MHHPNLWTVNQRHQEAEASETPFGDDGSHRVNIQPPGSMGVAGGPCWTKSMLLLVLSAVSCRMYQLSHIL